MLQRIARDLVAPKVGQHRYLVVACDGEALETNCRHTALQAYILKRKALNDFASEPDKYRVRFFCDGREYLNDQESFPPGAGKDRGKSCRQLSGAVRPYPWERAIP